MANKLLIIMSGCDPDDVRQIVPPLSQAVVAAAMGFEVEVLLSGRTATLARRGRAQQLRYDGGQGPRSVAALIGQAAEGGVIFKLCTSPADTPEEELMTEIAEVVGEAYLISEAMDTGTVTFTY